MFSHFYFRQPMPVVSQCIVAQSSANASSWRLWRSPGSGSYTQSEHDRLINQYRLLQEELAAEQAALVFDERLALQSEGRLAAAQVGLFGDNPLPDGEPHDADCVRRAVQLARLKAKKKPLPQIIAPPGPAELKELELKASAMAAALIAEEEAAHSGSKVRRRR